MTTWTGAERRHNRVYVTRNTEYHLRDGVCVAVRDRLTGAWLAEHFALGSRLSGGFRARHGALVPDAQGLQPGDSLCFEGPRGEALFTSVLVEITRPPREALARYAAAQNQGGPAPV